VIEFRVLGPVEVVRDGSSLPLGSAKQRALLAVFLLNPNELLSRDRLIGELWGERAPLTAAHTLESYVHRLRKALGADGADLLVTRPGGYLFRLAPDALDLDRFERLLAEGRAARATDAPERAAAKLAEALASWRGRPLADIEYEPAAAVQLARLDGLRLAALEERVEIELALGHEQELVGELEALTREQPHHEGFHRQLMLALYRCGRQADALRVYRELRARLADELGLEPGPALQDVEGAILRHEPAAARPPRPGTDAPPRAVAAAGPAALADPPERAYATSFVGRINERRELHDLLLAPETRLVTLAGPGGAGKTRLATELAAELAPHFAHGAVVVDLSVVSDADLVTQSIAARLGLRESSGADAVDALGAFLRGRDALVVVDNFEQVLTAAPMLGELLTQAPGPTFLVTSRAPLRLAAERVYQVPPLELPERGVRLPLERLRELDAVRLFVERGRSARADFELSPANAEAVAELCVRLDGLPLALELAAARVRLLSPRAIVDRLARCLDLLRTEAPEVPQRHRTLRAAIEWSYDLLGAPEQQLFTRLGIFAGGFTLDAAEAVGGGVGVDVIDGVESLLDSNLLRPLPTAGDEPRFGMLETLREYAAERLAPSEWAADTRERHARSFLALAAEAEPALRDGRQVTWLERLDADQENVRLALGWAVDGGDVAAGLRGGAGLWRYWQVRGLLSEGREWLERLLTLGPPDLDPGIRADAIASAGRLAFVAGDHAAARDLLEASLEVHRAAGATVWAAMSHGILGLISRIEGDDARARVLLETGVALGRRSGDWWSQSQQLGVLGDFLLARGELAQARRVLLEGLRAGREAEDRRQVGRILGNLGLVALTEGHHDQAWTLLEEALAVQRELGDVWNATRAQAHLGVVARKRGDLDAARHLFGAALAGQAEVNDRTGVATSLELFAELAVGDGDPQRATLLFAAAGLLRDAVGLVPMNVFQREEPPLGRLRSELGDDGFEEAWAAGRSLMMDELVAYALDHGRSADAGALPPLAVPE
jgi:predicted ATPase/DNA-binding SARP family transcriptional activator/Tfp pilus assembly protein PilF